MKIRVISPKDHVNIFVPIPNALIMNRLTCLMMIRCVNKYTKGYLIESDQLFQLVKCIKDSKKIYGHYDLLEIATKDGDIVKISV